VDEPAADSGASHFLEHLLFKGTPTRSARQIAEAVDRVGGDMNAFTTKEYTAFYIRLLAADVELALDILSDILWSPSFRGEEVEAERQVILEEILMHGDEPADLIHDVFASALFPAHPLGREVLGKEATVRDLGRDRIAAFHADHYRPVNVVFAAAGNVDHDRMVDGIRARAGEVNGGQAPGRVAPSAGDRRRRFVVERDTEQAHLIVGVPGPARDDDDRHALTVIDHVLGGGMSSRLFQTIREERGLAYTVYSFRLLFQDAGSVGVYAGTSPANAPEVLDLMRAGIERMATEGVTDEELAAARSHLRGSLALGLEDSGARWSRIGHSQLIHGRVPDLDELEARMAGLTADQVNAVAHRYLSEPLTVATVGPPDGTETG
ncbi:MAG: M16 family metallopeptidase, partial [Acidimicrobiales bacterium]